MRTHSEHLGDDEQRPSRAKDVRIVNSVYEALDWGRTRKRSRNAASPS